MTVIDDTAFTELTERYRRELHVHCYRMLGSFEESEEHVQETFLRAWRRRETYAGRATFRAWLYRIATNACLDTIERRPRLPKPEPGLPAEVHWLQPYPDELLDGIATDEDGPDAVVVAKETIELAYLVAIQHLPPRQRAVLILRDVLGWSAKETAALLELSVPAANSALQRARVTLKEHLPQQRSEWAAGSDPTEQEREVLRRYVEATERADVDALAGLMREDLKFSLPPEPGAYAGRDEIVASWVESGFGSPEWGPLRCLVTRANRQPAVANYVRSPGDTEFRAMALDVLRFEDGEIAEIVTFGSDRFAALGLPLVLRERDLG